MKLGHNPISQFWPQLSDHLSLSKLYTGHCFRVTATQNLCNASIPNRHIMMITGHRQESSLQRYNSRSAERQRAVMSNLLGQSCGQQSFSTCAPWRRTSSSFGRCPAISVRCRHALFRSSGRSRRRLGCSDGR